MSDQSGSFVPSYNAMQAQAGLTPGSLPGMPPVTIPMGMPMMSTPHPSQVATMLQQQAAMMQYSAPQPSQMFGSTTLASPGMFGPRMPPPMMGGASAARQRGVDASGSALGFAQGAVGIGASMLGGAAAFALGGPLGALAYEASGMSGWVQNKAGSIFNPITEQRERALALQNSSTGWATGGGMLSATGQGMSGVAAQQISNRIGRMADSHTFQRETGGMFNRGDLDRITRLSGQLGMLDQTQSADQVTREVKKISKALSNFMKLAEEPDIQQAMQQMGRMRNMGFTAPEMVSAASNARTYARMAGVSVQEVMQNAEQGARAFQQVGLSGATGFQAGMGAQGMARAGVSSMSTRQLALAGGQEGIQQSLLAGAATEATRDVMTLGMVRRDSLGRFQADFGALRGLGGQSLSQAIQGSASRAHGLGSQGLGGFMTQRREMQDQIADQLGPQGMIMMQMLRAQQIQQQTGGRIGLGGALMTATGGNEQQARSLELMMHDPAFFQRIQQQNRITQRDAVVRRRDAIRDRSSFGGRFSDAFAHTISEPIAGMIGGPMDAISENFAQAQDSEEALAVQGEGSGRVIRGQRYSSGTIAAEARDRLRRDRRRMYQAAARVTGQASERTRSAEETESAWEQVPVLSYFHGPQGFGLTRARRGGDSYRDTVIEGADFGTRAANFVGLGAAPSAREVRQLGQQQSQYAQTWDRALSGTAEERMATARNATRDLGPNLQGGAGANAEAAAAGAMREYQRSRNTFFGMGNRQTNQADMHQQVIQRMVASGISREDAQRAVGSQTFMATAAQAARRGMSEEERANLDASISQGQSAAGGLAAEGTDRLNEIINENTETTVESLGLNDWRRSSSEDITRVREAIGQSGAEGELRRKLFTAMIMERSSDSQTSHRGTQQIAQLRQSTQDTELFERVHGEVEASVEALEPATREDMAKRLEGKTAEQAQELVATAGAGEQRTHEAMVAISGRNMLGEAGARAYQAAGGGAEGVAALRAHKSDIKDRRIRRMIDEGASDQEIATAIDSGIDRGIEEQTAATSGGAEAGEDEQAATEVTDNLAAAIQEGMGQFPEAVDRFDEASRRLNDAARQMGGNMDYAGIRAGVDAGGGGSPGYPP